MSLDTHNLTNLNDKGKPIEPKPGQGNAVQKGGQLTPESTPEPDAARNRADERRNQKEAPTPSSKGESEAKDASSTEQLIREVLSYNENEHRKILGLGDIDPEPYFEEEAIKKAFWNRGF